MAGNTLGGRYTVQDKIGTGGMATVYRGLDEVLGRTVAIKTMLPQYANDPSFAARFKQEAQAAAALQSPYIVQVYDWGKDGDTYYIVMEYLRGTDLKSGIRKHGALDCKKVAQIGSQIAQALSVAHKHDIIHRDIKPQNIMVQPDGNIKVMDFGIARAKNSHLTTDNSVLGTAHYVSPEQTQGKELGPTTDIYSLGVVMYEAATGEVPFKGDDAITVALKQVNEQPKPPSQLNPSVDPSLEAIILKCMQKDPAARFQSANELYRVLRDYLAGRTQAVNEATAVISRPSANDISSRIGTITSDPTIRRGVTTGGYVTGKTGQRFRPPSATELAAAEEEERRHRRNRNIAIVAILAIAAIVGGIVGFIRWQDAQVHEYAVPNLLNLTVEQADQYIREDGHFVMGNVKESYSSTVAEGRVMDQTPSWGRKFAEGTVIDLVVSKGPEPAVTVEVPNLINMTPSEVEQELARVGLIGKAGDNVFSDDVEVGCVAEQDPKPKTEAKAGDTVTYFLSKGPEGVVVPNVSGDTEEAAREALIDAGLEPRVEYVESSTVAKGYVISISPESGTVAEKGDVITVTISKGVTTTVVPNVVGSSESDARSSINYVGLTPYVVYENSSTVAEGYVISTNPGGGNTVDLGTTVTITVSSGPAYHDVTNVVGQSVDVARARLEGEGYTVEAVFVDDEAAAGTVIDMSPTSAPAGATITLTVSNGPETGE